MEIQYCSRCKTEQELKYFSITKRGTHYKTCDGCRSKYKGKKLDTDSSTTAEEDKYIIVMDVETNGLIRGAVYPRIVQFSWGLYNTKGGVV
jgi:formate dehydrogenase maturation protein FdhE